jgi:Family of unknown function (DUF6515)
VKLGPIIMRNMPFRRATGYLVALALVTSVVPASAQVRSARRGAVVKGEEGKAAAVGPRGVAVKGEEGYAAAGRRGAVVSGDEGYAAVGRRGAVVQGEDGYAAAGRHGAVVAGEEGYAAVGRRGVVVGNTYESYEGWKVAAGVGAAIAVGTMLARPPRAAVTITVGGSSYWYADGAYYARVMSGGAMVYQVVGPPVGAVIRTLPAGCTSVRVGGIAYSRCGPTYYQRVGAGYQVVVLR